MSEKRDRRGDGGRGDKGFGAVPSPNDAVGDEDSTPVNLGAVRADDEFIEALRSAPIVPARTRVDYELAELLSTWRDDLLSEPIAQRPTLDEVEAGIAAARRRDTQKRSLRIARYAGGAAAAFALIFGGVSVVAHNATPGDPLWGVKEVMFGADASSTLAMADVKEDLDRAAAAMAAGDLTAAEFHLKTAQSKLGDVRETGDRTDLQRKLEELRNRIIAPATSSSTTQTPRPGPVETATSEPAAPPVTVTAPQETVTITPSETILTEPPTSASEPPPPPPPPPPTTIVSDPPSESPPVSTSEVPVIPPG